MSAIDRGDDGFIVDAALLAEAFSLSPVDVLALLKEGAISVRCETGEGTDTGRYRLTFFHDRRAVRLVVDENGTILSRKRFGTSGCSLAWTR
ncbi:MAG: DUF6522 family protein [Gammaproteobacteria bacterium]